MRHFPSIKTVLFCSFSAMVLVLSIPANPIGHHHRSATHNGIPTLAQPVLGNQPTNQSGNSSQTPQQSAPTPRQDSGNETTPNATPKPVPGNSANGQTSTGQDQPQPVGQASKGPTGWGYTNTRTAKLRVRVIDGRTHAPLPGAEVVVIETEQRYKTDSKGETVWFNAPVFRNPRYRPMIAELHGQLGVIVYKNGYRDSIHLGIRMHEGIKQETTVWMYKIGPEDRRIEPVLYQEPYHHIWLIQLADKFRQKSQIGEGPERP